MPAITIFCKPLLSLTAIFICHMVSAAQNFNWRDVVFLAWPVIFRLDGRFWDSEWKKLKWNSSNFIFIIRPLKLFIYNQLYTNLSLFITTLNLVKFTWYLKPCFIFPACMIQWSLRYRNSQIILVHISDSIYFRVKMNFYICIYISHIFCHL